MGWLSTLFGSSDTASKTVEIIGDSIKGIGSWIDEKDYTPEEKAKAYAKLVDVNLKMVELTANESSTRSITRRYMAWAIVGFTLFWASVAMVFSIMGETETVNRMVAIIVAFNIGWGFAGVIALYFGVQFKRK